MADPTTREQVVYDGRKEAEDLHLLGTYGKQKNLLKKSDYSRSDVKFLKEHFPGNLKDQKKETVDRLKTGINCIIM